MKNRKFFLFVLLFLTSFSGAFAKGPAFLPLEDSSILGLTLEIVLISMALTEVIKRVSEVKKDAPRWASVVLSWCASLNVALFFFYFGVGFLENLTLLSAIAYGFIISLLGNGLYSLNFFQTIFKAFNKKELY